MLGYWLWAGRTGSSSHCLSSYHTNIADIPVEVIDMKMQVQRYLWDGDTYSWDGSKGKCEEKRINKPRLPRFQYIHKYLMFVMLVMDILRLVNSLNAELRGRKLENKGKMFVMFVRVKWFFIQFPLKTGWEDTGVRWWCGHFLEKNNNIAQWSVARSLSQVTLH